MSIVLLESFEVNGGTKWSGLVQSGIPRTGANGRIVNSDSALWTVQAAEQHSTYIFGFAVKNAHDFTAAFDLIRLFNPTGVQIGQLRMEITQGGGSRLRYQRFKDSVYLATTANAIIDNLSASWYYVELKVVCHATTGSVEIKTNEVSRATATNVDTTAASGAATFGRFTLGSLSSSSIYMDDFYCCNGAGSTNNDFLGDTTVHKLLPNADGDTNLWVGSDGNSTSNYLLVDENSPSASDYVESGTLTATDLYNFENLPGGVSGRTVFGVEHWSWAKTTALPNTMAQVTKLSITEVEGPTETMTVTDTWYVHRQETKPGGGAWATSDVDSAQHGSRVKS